MGKQRKSTPNKFNNWRFPFKSSSEDCRGGDGGSVGKKTIPGRLLHRNNRFESHGLGFSASSSNSSSKTKKVSYLTSKCHAVGITSSADLEEPNKQQDNEDNETYALINECNLTQDGENEINNSVNGKHPPHNHHHSQHPPLRPLYFEVPQEEEHQLVERSWIYETIHEIFDEDRNTRGIVLHGNPGTGKTTIALQLVENSCFGRSVKTVPGENEKAPLVELASKIVAYHFCQVDNRTTCLVSDFVHSIAAQMCQAPGFSEYRIFLDEHPHTQEILSSQNCVMDPKKAFCLGILAPLRQLRLQKKLPQNYYLLVLDSIDEAESHRPGNNGDTIASFISKHVFKLPPWFKILITIRSNQKSALLDLVPFKFMSLDTLDDHVDGDVRQYVSARLQSLVSSVSNKASSMGGTGKKVDKVNKVVEVDPGVFPGLKTHLLQLSGGSFLFLKLTIDLIEHGHLVIKPNTFKGLPVSLQEVFLLHCNLRFSTPSAFNSVAPILSTCLVALNPLNLLEIYHSVNSLRFKDNLPWVEFLRLFKSVQGLLVKRLDATYMFFHSSFRDWLLAKDVCNSRFQCSPEMGHAAIVLRLLRVERPLATHKLLDLAHHLLKAKSLRPSNTNANSTSTTTSFHHFPLKHAQAILLLNSCENISSALSSPANIYKTNLKVSRLLLLSGADPSTSLCPLNGKSLLEISAEEGNLPLLELLLEFGMSVETQNEAGNGPLHTASASGQLNIVRYLMEQGARPNQLNARMECPMVLAALAEEIAVLDHFLQQESGTCWNNGEVGGGLSKHEAILHSLIASCASGQALSVAHLIMRCPYLNLSAIYKGCTPLIAACQEGQSKIVKLLRKNGVNLNARDESGTPPIIHSVKGQHYNILDTLLSSHEGFGSSGCDVDATDMHGRTALIHSVQLGDIISAEILINSRCDMNKRDADGRSALSWACFAENSKMISYLLQYPVNLQDSDNGGRAPLHVAASCRREDIVQALLDANAPLEQTDFVGNRPLDYAAEFSSPEVVKLLLRKGAKLGATVWKKAKNPAILLVLFNKLLEDGMFLLQNGQVSEAQHRFEYALRKLDDSEDSEEDDASCKIMGSSQQHELRNQFLFEMLKCQTKKGNLEECVTILLELIETNSMSESWSELKEDLQQEFDLDIPRDFDLSTLKPILESKLLGVISGKRN